MLKNTTVFLFEFKIILRIFRCENFSCSGSFEKYENSRQSMLQFDLTQSSDFPLTGDFFRPASNFPSTKIRVRQKRFFWY